MSNNNFVIIMKQSKRLIYSFKAEQRVRSLTILVEAF